MTRPERETWIPTAWRWMCPICGRFLPDSSVGQCDRPDNGSHYGVATDVFATCSKCRLVYPERRPIKFARSVHDHDPSPEDEHSPWSYTEFGVLCVCGRPLPDSEICPSTVNQ